MKLSEAILLGSTVLAPRAGGQHFSETQSGCALGMAAVARGCRFYRVTTPVAERDRRTLGVEGIWGTWVLQEVDRPCDCRRIWIPRRKRIKEAISHLFDYHIMIKRNWTLEQLVAWVETVEPKEAVPPRAARPAVPREMFSPSQPASPLPHEELRQEAEEWQAVRVAFQARYERSSKGLRQKPSPPGFSSEPLD